MPLPLIKYSDTYFMKNCISPIIGINLSEKVNKQLSKIQFIIDADQLSLLSMLANWMSDHTFPLIQPGTFI